MRNSKKINLENLTFCIPVRIDSSHRERNLLTILKFYAQNIRCNYIVMEADKEQHLKELPSIEGLVYHFIYDENPTFHRTYYINKMLAQTTTEIAASWDTDAIAPITQLSKAYKTIIEEQATMAYPYDGCFWSINEFFSSLFCKNLKISLLEKSPMMKFLMCGYYSVGGAFLVNVRLYKECGWENEHFIGWGPEDAERYKRLMILNKKPIKIPGALYHLYHSRGNNSSDGNEQVAYITKKEYCHVCSMQPDELKEYIKTWNWIK